ncbi:hypothetical protein AVEN_2335-1 [Araneus ventricosus]|uniref:Uncharacterized protein n=1 Tax=Araneus ventricosus TaxID=182803 RepID=A0A4Y2UVM2_ARAVE|nr:hypothetical protein AVEN_2335-1 [Araneus ventricosus]
MTIPALQSDSASSVLNLLETTYEFVRSLQTLGYEVEQFAEVMFVYMLLQKLDASSKVWFEREFNKSNEYFCEFLRPGQCRVPNSQLILQNSVFGLMASGRLSVTGNQSSRVIQCKLIANLEDLHKDMTKFLELEKIEKPIKSVEEEKCEEHFLKTYSRNSEGRYVVQLPLKKDPECLGESKTSDLGSLNSLWRRLSKNPELLSLYRDFMQEYEALCLWS